MQGSKESYSPQVHNLYQDYFGEAEQPPYSHTWLGQTAPSNTGPFYYQDDADCITFLRGCLAGLCCCCLLEQCCL